MTMCPFFRVLHDLLPFPVPAGKGGGAGHIMAQRVIYL